MTILGIETSCDETSAAIVQADEKTQPVTLLVNTVATSLALHAETGGIIPEVAAREQLKYCIPVINQTLKDAQMTPDDIDAIAVTYGPGLIGSLLVGVETAKTLAYVWKKPLIPVNHLYGHIYANWLIANSKWPIENEKKLLDKNNSHKPFAISHLPVFPALALVVSGGHTDLVLMKDHGQLSVVGATRDDAAGEAFDKIGRLLGLPYPAGATISRLAETGNRKAFALPRPMIGSHDLDYSFSGLKTAVLNLTKKRNWDFSKKDPETTQLLSDVCASVEEAIVDILIRKTIKAAKQFEVKTILLGGGVGANGYLQKTLSLRAEQEGLSVSLPDRSLCTDNAAMIAAAACYNPVEKPWSEVTADPELYY